MVRRWMSKTKEFKMRKMVLTAKERRCARGCPGWQARGDAVVSNIFIAAPNDCLVSERRQEGVVRESGQRECPYEWMLI